MIVGDIERAKSALWEAINDVVDIEVDPIRIAALRDAIDRLIVARLAESESGEP